MSRILIAEDELRVATFVEKGLKANGFTTAIVPTGHEAILLALDDTFDLILLDLGLPGKDGLLVIEELRGQGCSTPIIILTARDDVQDKVNGFELGADDYVTKPFRFEELLARVRTRIRTYRPLQSDSQDCVLSCGELVLDLRTRLATISDRPVELSSREFTLVETFIRHSNQVMSREQLLDHVWGYDYAPGSNVVDVYVGYLRKKLGAHLIETVRGMGYRMPS
ncbi:MAG: response regulator transcription factor [Phormidesmis sp. RL_2_1]|nr:response regulator transcription factor [Phormidesmis sp. RL_2_1]